MTLSHFESREAQWRAIRENVEAWYVRSATRGLRPGEQACAARIGDILCTRNHCCIPFDDLRSRNECKESLLPEQDLDCVMDWYQSQDAEPHARDEGVVFWHLHPDTPVSLDVQLFARGAGTNWRPHWMIRNSPPSVVPQSTPESWEIRVTSCGQTDERVKIDSTLKGLTGAEESVWRLEAWQKGKCVGECFLNITSTTGSTVGALFDMEVEPDARNQGIGTALAREACQLGHTLGCSQYILNATDQGESVYRLVGFESLSHGYTWHLRYANLSKPAPSIVMVKFLEAVGRGDIEHLNSMGKALTTSQMQEQTRNEMTPLEIAVHFQQKESASWLIKQGVLPDIISLWDLGWKARVPALLAKHPEAVNHRSGDWKATPLHQAIERNDLELAEAVLAVPNDLKSRDAMFGATPLQWAAHFGRQSFADLIELKKTQWAQSKDV